MNFEYKVVSLKSIRTETEDFCVESLNKFGKQGWELVTVSYENKRYGEAVFKRAKKEFSSLK